MAKSVLNAKHFQMKPLRSRMWEAALWPNGPVCPFCQSGERVGRLCGRDHPSRPVQVLRLQEALYRPYGSIFESSHLALHLWLQVIHLMCASKRVSPPANPTDAQLLHENRLVCRPPRSRSMTPARTRGRWAGRASLSKLTKPS